MSEGPKLRIEVRQDNPHRRCGSCTLCCKLLPVERNLAKPAGVRCAFQTHKGCKVYARLSDVSPSCHFWSCRWLVDDDCANLHRPDRSHYVIDVMPDFIGATQNGGEIIDVPVVQIWIDPNYPNAHRDPALRRYLERIGQEQRSAALVRFNSRDALLIAPPSLSDDGQWHEKKCTLQSPDSSWKNPLAPIHDHVENARQQALKRVDPAIHRKV